ncbi:hypothetical protein P22_1797 [Propionispora sp. 2/2-37]|uniref:TetR/AcrR family transcriptional regulator n=1 Tax=Propionispora sp. 2/2-37 TaxID=1677858 RepID=UPI0006BB7999|nr:TetR/AcrR family transcriptional regulator [Propionispora sp. 2/2-37]CUH95719.1 hypothetical protein P22_1797 [Propionispora sp. 2/2-37]
MSAKQFPSRKDKIIVSAIDIVNELGLQGLSTKEIAVRQGIAESALYRHFKNKDEILVEALRYYAKFDPMINTTIRRSNFSLKESLLFFAKVHAEYYENYPAITAVTYYYTCFLNNPATAKVSRDIYDSRRHFFKELIEKARLSGEVGDAFTSAELTEVLYGYFTFTVIRWRLNHYNFPLKEQMLSMFEKIFVRCS